VSKFVFDNKEKYFLMSEEAVEAADAPEEQKAAEEVKPSAEQAQDAAAQTAAPETPAAIEPAEPAAESAPVAEAPPAAESPAEPAAPEDVSYQSVEKEGTVTAIWEMQGQKHLRTIDPRSIEGKQILALFETAG